MPDFDVIVVGSGACGGVAARRLTELGLRVLVLEAGPARTDLVLPIDAGDGPERVEDLTTPDQRVECPTLGFTPPTRSLYVLDKELPYSTSHPFLWTRSRLLGGRTRSWARGTPRMTDLEFRAAEADGHGASWPLREADLKGDYERVESYVDVIGSSEAAGAPPGHHPSRPMEEVELAFKAAVESRWPERRVVLFPYANPFFPGTDASDWGWLERQDAARGAVSPTADCSLNCLLRPAAKTGLLSIRTNAIVWRVEVDWVARRVTGVQYVDRCSKQMRSVSGNVVMLCASTLESTRILLNSRSAQASHGLANSSGVLGHYLLDHVWGAHIVAQRSRPACMAPPPLLIPPFPRPGVPFLRRYQLVCEWGAQREGVQFLLIKGQGEGLAYHHNRVALDPTLVDAWGIPSLRIEYTQSENDRLMAHDMVETASEIARAAGFTVLEQSPTLLPAGASVHELGTARMGDDPSDSVVNSYCQAWDFPNLFVADGAVFPSSGAQNPTLTMMAICSRASSFIAQELLKKNASRPLDPRLALEGGSPVFATPLMVEKGVGLIGAEEKAAVIEVLESRSLYRYYGPRLLNKVATFESNFSQLMGVPHALACSSGTAALRLALVGLGIGPGDEVILPAVTFIASAGAVIAQGATPVFTEVDDHLLLDPADVEPRITPRTKAIMPVHLFGMSCDMRGIMELAARRHLHVIEDTAQACGVSWLGRRLGTFGSVGAFSFQLDKHITAGEGGAIVTTNPDVYVTALQYHDQGGHFALQRGGFHTAIESAPILGENLRMGEIAGAILECQLRRLDWIIERIAYARRFVLDRIADTALAFLPDDDRSHTATGIGILLDDAAQAEKFAAAVSAEGVQAARIYGGRTVYEHSQLQRKRLVTPRCPFACPGHPTTVDYKTGLCPRSEALVSRAVAIPLGPLLNDVALAGVVQAIQKAVSRLPSWRNR